MSEIIFNSADQTATDKTTRKLLSNCIIFSWIVTVSLVLLELVEHEAYDYQCINANQDILNSSSNYVDQLLLLYQNRPEFGAPSFPTRFPWKNLTILLFALGSRVSLIRWYLGDIFAILLCRLMTLILKGYKRELGRTMQAVNEKKKRYETERLEFTTIRNKYLQIYALFGKMEEIIGPLVYSCLWINLYLLVSFVSKMVKYIGLF